MIPKIIHYCWFGRGKKPEIVEKCIESWKKYLPDYQIMEWNEDNFDINIFQYSKDAYEAKKYAFASDVARVKALYEYGGLYFDTDVEVLKPLEEEFLKHECLLGFELENYVATSFMACVPHFPLMKDFYDLYQNLSFYDEKGEIITGTNVNKLTTMLERQGLVRNNMIQTLENGITIYPIEYFSPFDYANCIYEITENSFCVHHFYVSWLPKHIRRRKQIKKVLVKLLGKEKMRTLINFVKKLMKIYS